jgi:hypothetical protein
MRTVPANTEVVMLSFGNGRRVRIADGRHLQIVGRARPKRDAGEQSQRALREKPARSAAPH